GKLRDDPCPRPADSAVGNAEPVEYLADPASGARLLPAQLGVAMQVAAHRHHSLQHAPVEGNHALPSSGWAKRKKCRVWPSNRWWFISSGALICCMQPGNGPLMAGSSSAGVMQSSPWYWPREHACRSSSTVQRTLVAFSTTRNEAPAACIS